MNDKVVHITPSVLKWARESSGYTQAQIVERLGLKSLDLQALNRHETQASELSYPQLKKLAKLYKRPIALFFLPTPPQEESIKEDFRSSLPNEITINIPPVIRHIVRKAKVRQMNLQELNTRSQQTATVFDWPIQNKQDPIKLAKQVRELLNTTIDAQIKWKDIDKALKNWRDAIEKIGIWVFKDSFRDDHYCGFCIYDRQFPIIYINNNQAKERQIFTLFHELGHILLGQGGIDFRATPPLTTDYQQTEVFCNAFAGDFLLPTEILNYSKLIDDDEIINIANKYKVSFDVVLRKYRDKNLISWEKYNHKIQQRNAQRNDFKKSGKKSSSGNYYANQKTYLGDKYIDAVFTKYYQQQINKEQVADYCDVNVSGIDGLQ